MEQGIYFNPQAKEITRIAVTGEELPGKGWERLAREIDLGLMAVRAMLVAAGHARGEATDSYWHLPLRRIGDQEAEAA